MSLLYNLKRLYWRIGLSSAHPSTLLYNVHRLLAAPYKIISPKKQGSSKIINGVSVSFPIISKNRDNLRVLALCGIGDVLWSFVLIKSLCNKYNCKKIDLLVHYNGDHRAGRSFNLLKRFSYINSVTAFSFPVHGNPPVDKEGYLSYTFTAGPAEGHEKNSFDYKFIINTYLEHGWEFKDICDLLGLNPQEINHSVFSDYKFIESDYIGVRSLKAAGIDNYIVVYFGALADNTRQGLNYQSLWSVEEWVEVVSDLKNKYKHKIIIVGASYDSDYFADFTKKYGKSFHEDCINAVGQYSIEETIAILKSARFVIGFASGITISSVYLGVPTAIFWRPQNISMSPQYKKFGFHEGFATNWIPPDILNNKKYIPLWYTIDSPKSVLCKISESQW